MSAFEFVAWDNQEYPQPPQTKQKLARRQSSQVVESKSDPAFDTSVQFFSVGQPRYSTKDFGSFAREAYKANPTSYKCINLVSRTAAGIRWKFYTDETMKREVTDHDMIRLWNKPNGRYARTRFIRDLFVFWQIAGNAYIYANRPGKNAPPQELWSLRPDRVKIIAGENDIRAYHYGVNTYGGKTYDPKDVLHLNFLDPQDDWYGMSPLNPVLALVDQQNEGQGWNLALMQNSGRPAGALVYPNQIREETLNGIMRQIDSRLSGKRNAGRPLVLDNGVNYIEMGKTPLEMDWSHLREMNIRDIASVLDVAPELVGDAAGKTFANVHEALQSLYTEKVLPMLDEYQDEMNMWLPGMYDQPIYAAYDRNDIEALQENKQVASTRATAGWNSGKLTLNEARKMEGMDALPGGNVLKLNGAIVPVAHLEEYAEQSIIAKMAGLQNATLAAQQPPNISTNNTPTQQNGAQTPQQQGQSTNGATTPSATSRKPTSDTSKPDTHASADKTLRLERDLKAFNLTSDEDKDAYRKQMSAARERWDDRATDRIATYFTGEQKAIVKALKAHPVVADITTTLQNTLTAQSDILKNVLLKLDQDVGDDIGNEVAKSFPAVESDKVQRLDDREQKAFTVNMYSADVVARLLQFAGIKVKYINLTTLGQLQDALAEGVSNGESIPQLVKRIDALYLQQIIPNRSTVIARTEVVSASNASAMAAGRQYGASTGQSLSKVWLATGDNRTRPTHQDADGQEVGIDEYFEVGGEMMDAPGDPTASIDETSQCRCTVYFQRITADSVTDLGSDDSGSLDDLESAMKPVSIERKRRYNPYREFQEALA